MLLLLGGDASHGASSSRIKSIRLLVERNVLCARKETPRPGKGKGPRGVDRKGFSLISVACNQRGAPGPAPAGSSIFASVSIYFLEGHSRRNGVPSSDPVSELNSMKGTKYSMNYYTASAPLTLSLFDYRWERKCKFNHV